MANYQVLCFYTVKSITHDKVHYEDQNVSLITLISIPSYSYTKLFISEVTFKKTLLFNGLFFLYLFAVSFSENLTFSCYVTKYHSHFLIFTLLTKKAILARLYIYCPCTWLSMYYAPLSYRQKKPIWMFVRLRANSKKIIIPWYMLLSIRLQKTTRYRYIFQKFVRCFCSIIYSADILYCKIWYLTLEYIYRFPHRPRIRSISLGSTQFLFLRLIIHLWINASHGGLPFSKSYENYL